MKLFCDCGKEVKLEELPANYNYLYQGKCNCGKYYGIEDCTDVVIELEELLDE